MDLERILCSKGWHTCRMLDRRAALSTSSALTRSFRSPVSSCFSTASMRCTRPAQNCPLTRLTCQRTHWE